MENAATIHVVSEVLVGNMQVQTCAPVAEDILEDFAVKVYKHNIIMYPVITHVYTSSCFADRSRFVYSGYD